MKPVIKHSNLLRCNYCLFIVLMIHLSAQHTQGQNIPVWVIEHWEIMVNDDRPWIADNSAYTSENEIYEAYGMKWEWGLGNKSIKGRLYGIIDDKDVGAFWEFHSVWHPGEKSVKDFQFGSDETLGIGTLIQTGPASVEQAMEFFAPDGSSYKMGHRVEIKNGERHSKSFFIDADGQWQERRFYIWKTEE